MSGRSAMGLGVPADGSADWGRGVWQSGRAVCRLAGLGCLVDWGGGCALRGSGGFAVVGVDRDMAGGVIGAVRLGQTGDDHSSRPRVDLRRVWKAAQTGHPPRSPPRIADGCSRLAGARAVRIC
jgi:hypothetical protein